jgi:hypothetical protein
MPLHLQLPAPLWPLLFLVVRYLQAPTAACHGLQDLVPEAATGSLLHLLKMAPSWWPLFLEAPFSPQLMRALHGLNKPALASAPGKVWRHRLTDCGLRL